MPALLVGLVGVLTAGIGTARAGGARLAPVAERYEPGEVATVVGYTGGPVMPVVPRGPFYAYLRPLEEGWEPGVLDADVALGPLVLEETGRGGYLALRVSITFEVPEDLGAGEHLLWYCDDPCTRAQIGDLIPSPLSIGVDPVRPVTREWAFDDPEVANLAPDALIAGPGPTVTAAEVRAGLVSVPADPPPTTVAPPVPIPTAPAAPAAPPVPTGAGPTAAEETDWTLPTVLVLLAGAGTWVVLAGQERRSDRRAPTRLPAASAGHRSAAAGRG